MQQLQACAWRKAETSTLQPIRSSGLFPQAFRQGLPSSSTRAWRLQVLASKGFDQKAASTKQTKKGEKKAPKLERYLDLAEIREQNAAGWTRVASLQDFVSKPLKAIILDTGKAIVVYKVGDKVYCSDANSTAYQFPLVDANILQTKSGPAVEVPLDGTTYDLATGKVLSWCPKNTIVRKALGALKDNTEPIDLPVFPAKVEGQDVLVKFG